MYLEQESPSDRGITMWSRRGGLTAHLALGRGSRYGSPYIYQQSGSWPPGESFLFTHAFNRDFL